MGQLTGEDFSLLATQIVIFREDILKKMTRHCIFAPRCDSAAFAGLMGFERRLDTTLRMHSAGPLWHTNRLHNHRTQRIGRVRMSPLHFASARSPDDAAAMDVTEHLVKTVLDQGHLCPLPLASRPVGGHRPGTSKHIMNCFQHIPESCGALHSPCGGTPQQRGPLKHKHALIGFTPTPTHPSALHTRARP